MPVDISETGDDTAVLSPEQVFAERFRKALFKRATSLLSDQAEELIADIEQELEIFAGSCDAVMSRLEGLIGEVGEAQPVRLGKLIEEYYAAAYDLFLQSRSAVAFYRLSGELLRAVTTTIVGQARAGLGLPADKPPSLAVIVLGPGGRHEFSPFCRLQLLLVHGQMEPSLAEAVGRSLHEGFETIGLRPDTLITPRNPDWRGTPEQWMARLDSGLKRGDEKDLIQLLRLADQSVLYEVGSLGSDFRRDSCGLLYSSRTAQRNLVDRISSLGSGTALMGGIRLVRRGAGAGMFNMLDHALLPFSAAITALSLIEGADGGDELRRIGVLGDSGKLDPDMARQLREAWQLFNELRLVSEARKQPQWDSQDLLFLPLSSCSADEQQRLAGCLRTVTLLKRRVESSFKRREEQAPC